MRDVFSLSDPDEVTIKLKNKLFLGAGEVTDDVMGKNWLKTRVTGTLCHENFD